MKKEDKKIITSTIYLAITMFLAGTVMGCLILFLAHKDAIRHYNVCQEAQLLDSIAEMKTEKDWYIKEASNGKLKIIELSREELDSLTKAGQ